MQRSRTFDDETEASHEPLDGEQRTLRRSPRVSWTDADGPHAVTLEHRAVAGSAAGVDLVVADSTTSRLHAEFEVTDDGLWVRDLGSRNGTFVRGVQVTHARIPEGATVHLGATALTVRYAPTPTPVELWPSESFGPLVGRSTSMRELFARLARIAPLDSTVLIQGETGTGKDLVARALHDASPRAGQPFVVVDCAALPEHLLEADLFGHTRGAFTGAVSARAGAFETANGGTVFLDEIGELSLSVQPKLLRALESRAVRRVGETNYREVNVRFVSATHRDISTMVNNGAFREDLYFRLAVLPVQVPPLRMRRDDIPLLAEHFLRGQSHDVLGPELSHELATRPWLGNVRELRSFVERAVALGPREALALVAQQRTTAADAPADATLDLPLREARDRWLQQFEREYLQAMLARHGGNVTAMAQAAGIDRSYAHRLIRRHGL